MEDKAKNAFNKKRFLILNLVLAVLFVFVIARLFFLTVIKKGNEFSRPLRENLTLRGIIYDRNINRLAISVERYSVGIKPSKIKANSVTFKQEFLMPLSKITGKSQREILDVIERHFNANLVYLSKKIPLTQEQINTLNAINGVLLLKEYERFYPNSSLASHIIGISGRQDEGLEGIEFNFNNVLKQQGDLVGSDIVLSIDRDIQAITERELKTTVQEEEAESGSVVIMNTETGDVITMANYPDFDLQKYREYQRNELIKRMKNLAVMSSDEIGSSFKAFTIALLSELNLLDMDRIYDCKGSYEVPGGFIIKDTAVYGKIKFQDVVKYSSNVGMIEAAMTIPKKTYYDYLKIFGFMEKTGIDLPYENSMVFRTYDKFRNQTRASVAIGQEIGLTPIQVATSACALVNGGYLLKPRIVLSIRRNENTIREYNVNRRRKILTENTNNMVWTLLKKVLERGGTGYMANITINGRKLDIAGKTGTAQYYNPRTGLYSENIRNTSFLGFIKRPLNTYVAFIIIRKPSRDPLKSTGSTIAVPLFKKIITGILDQHGSRFQ